jgi:hypothetical protein
MKILIPLAFLLFAKRKPKAMKADRSALERTIIATALNKGFNNTLAELLVAQAKLESANFTNNAFLKSNNAFGYKFYANSPYQTGKQIVRSSESDYYADYKSLADSTAEVLAWLQRREREGKFKIKDLTTALKYATALKIGNYYGANVEQYTKGLEMYLRTVKVP